MDEKKVINDKELKEAIDKLLSDAGVLLKIVSKLQDLRYEYLTNALPIHNISEFEAEIHELEDKFQMIDIW